MSLNQNLTPAERRERIRRDREWRRNAARKYEQSQREDPDVGKYRDIGSNRERRARLYERNFGEHAAWIRDHPCDTCGAPGPSDPSHAVPRSRGGDKTVLFPQCRTCHEAYEEHRGPPTREEAKRIAAGYWSRSPHNPENAT